MINQKFKKIIQIKTLRTSGFYSNVGIKQRPTRAIFFGWGINLTPSCQHKRERDLKQNLTQAHKHFSPNYQHNLCATKPPAAAPLTTHYSQNEVNSFKHRPNTWLETKCSETIKKAKKESWNPTSCIWFLYS